MVELFPAPCRLLLCVPFEGSNSSPSESDKPRPDTCELAFVMRAAKTVKTAAHILIVAIGRHIVLERARFHTRSPSSVSEVGPLIVLRKHRRPSASFPSPAAWKTWKVRAYMTEYRHAGPQSQAHGLSRSRLTRLHFAQPMVLPRQMAKVAGQPAAQRLWPDIGANLSRQVGPRTL